MNIALGEWERRRRNMLNDWSIGRRTTPEKDDMCAEMNCPYTTYVTRPCSLCETCLSEFRMSIVISISTSAWLFKPARSANSKVCSHRC